MEDVLAQLNIYPVDLVKSIFKLIDMKPVNIIESLPFISRRIMFRSTMMLLLEIRDIILGKTFTLNKKELRCNQLRNLPEDIVCTNLGDLLHQIKEEVYFIEAIISLWRKKQKIKRKLPITTLELLLRMTNVQHEGSNIVSKKLAIKLLEHKDMDPFAISTILNDNTLILKYYNDRRSYKIKVYRACYLSKIELPQVVKSSIYRFAFFCKNLPYLNDDCRRMVILTCAY